MNTAPLAAAIATIATAALFSLGCQAPHGTPDPDHPEAKTAGEVEAGTAFATASQTARAVTTPDLSRVSDQMVDCALTLQTARIQTAADNLKHVDTAGYKCARVYAAHATHAAAAIQDSIEASAGDGETPLAMCIQTRRDMSPGALEITNRSLDFAIDGEGFFSVRLEDGSIGYTRCGEFEINTNGRLVTSRRGLLLDPEISIPKDALSLDLDDLGRLSGPTASAPDARSDFGHFTLVSFSTPSALTFDGFFHATNAAGEPHSTAPDEGRVGTIVQGFLERSNVQSTREMVLLKEAEAALRKLHAVSAQQD